MADTRSYSTTPSAATSAEAPAAQVKKADLTWQHGEQAIDAAHKGALTERARDLVRRALGELFQESVGGPKASTLAHSVGANVGNATQLNRLGEESAQSGHAKLNNGGTSSET